MWECHSIFWRRSCGYRPRQSEGCRHTKRPQRTCHQWWFRRFCRIIRLCGLSRRARHPKDKALVENAVKLLYRSIYLDIEGMTFSNLEELNTAIRISLLDFNEKVMAVREMSHKEMFFQGEKDIFDRFPWNVTWWKRGNWWPLGRTLTSRCSSTITAFQRSM